MKKLFLLFLLLFLFSNLISCSNNINEDEEALKANVTTKSKINNQDLSNKYQTHHIFSTSVKPDLFQVTLTSNKAFNSDVIFKIISTQGKEIYNQKFKLGDLIGYGLVEKWGNGKKPTDKEFKNYISKRLQEFFQEKNFLKPAISSKDKFEINYSDKKIWNDIKSDKTAIGFHYLVGKEDGRWIAFSKKLNKVVMYRNCC